MSLPPISRAIYVIGVLAAPTARAADQGSHAIHYSVHAAVSPDTLRVCVQRQARESETHLSLRAALSGVASQVADIACGNAPLTQSAPGYWIVPAGCSQICWQVPLANAIDTIASMVQSLHHGRFRLLSELSSLPRFTDAEPGSEYITIEIPNTSVYPDRDAQTRIVLPTSDGVWAPALFMLINATAANTAIDDSVTLTYLLDNPAASSRLPAIDTHMKGLRWLRHVLGDRQERSFTVGWIGTSAHNMASSGAAGHRILLTNYNVDGELPFGDATLLYVALHEAFHQLAPHAVPWISESLASYFGILALQVALPDDIRPAALSARMRSGATQFNGGLVTINRELLRGSREEYGAFYTKGIAFWHDVDTLLQRHQHRSLASILPALLNARCTDDGTPIDLSTALNLPPDAWDVLIQTYLFETLTPMPRDSGTSQ